MIYRLASILALFFAGPALAANGDEAVLPAIRVGVEGGGGDLTLTLQILALITILTLAPAIVMMLTSFTRIVVVLSFLRNAIGTPTVPPNQVLMALSLFITFFVMTPVFTPVYQDAFLPLSEGEITQAEALERARAPVHEFLLKHTAEKDIAMFVRMSAQPPPATPGDVPFSVLIPSFVVSELRTAFTIGFLIYLPFVIIDLAIASTLMSMGMFMLPPMMVSLPFKLILFVVVDGWALVIGSLARSFMS